MRHHDHEHDHDDPAVDTSPQNRTESLDPAVMKAVAAGRPDVLGTSGMLGLQRAAGNRAAAGVAEEGRSPVHDVISGGGAPLDEDTRTDMEARMGQDFGDVRVHTGDAADASARSVSAHAYTVGSNIVFQRGGYEPGSADGQKLLAHELTHVVQQRSGPVDGTPAPGGVSVSHPSDRFEVEAAANAERVMGQPVPVAPQPTPAPAVQRSADETEVQAAHDPTLPPVQREGEEEQEEEVQAAHDPALGAVQRQEEEEEPEEA
jgi:Domain of unknown function (DUF4157)